MSSQAGDTLKGAAGGAATGAVLGSAVGPWGTAIGGAAGGLIGGIGGYFGHHDDPKPQYQDRNQILGLINRGYAPGGITSYAAPQLQMGGDPYRQAQLQQMGQLQGIASGQQMGAGELAAQRQYGNALAAQQAQARMARGPNAALAYRNAANQSAALGVSAAGAGQQAALQDQQGAQGLLGQVGAQGRAQDYATANANAGYQQGTNQINSQNYQALLSQLTAMNAGTFSGQQAQAIANQQQDNALLGGVIGAGGNIIAAQQRAGK